MEKLLGDKDRFDALITALNVGFDRDRDMTLEKCGERFVENRTSGTRRGCGPGSPGSRTRRKTGRGRSSGWEAAERARREADHATDTEAPQLRDQCALACLTRMGDILGASRRRRSSGKESTTGSATCGPCYLPSPSWPTRRNAVSRN
jgi:hypothetical protein